MSKLALQLPGFGKNLQISPDAIAPQFQADKFDTLPELVSQVINLAFIAAGFVLFVFVFIGAFRYLTAGDNKENVAKARARITWAILGFLFLIIAFAISQYVKSIFPIQNVNIQNITIPTSQEINNQQQNPAIKTNTQTSTQKQNQPILADCRGKTTKGEINQCINGFWSNCKAIACDDKGLDVKCIPKELSKEEACK